MDPYILDFDSADACLATVGGKGRNLAKLSRAGLSVPPGVFVTTAAYREFVRANGIEAPLLRLVGDVKPDDPIELENASSEIRRLFDRGQIPDDVACAIASSQSLLFQAIYPGRRFSLGPISSRASGPADLCVEASMAVAVRSSATAEDLPGLSFAGQQETYLNVIGSGAVCQAVKRCWSSLWTARALGYRAHYHIAHDGLAMAVIVQQMVASESSGVVFTANPLTGNHNELIIDASVGLGEAVVAGQVEPDHYVVDTREWRIASIKLGAKAISMVPRRGGGTQIVSWNGGKVQALPDDEIIALAQVSKCVAVQFGSPQDIEWAWAGRQLYLLQARPITSLYPLPPNSKTPGSLRAYLNFSAIQGMIEPMTPLGYAGIKMFAQGMHLGDPAEFLPCVGGRLFLDITMPARDARFRRVLLQGLARVDPGARRALAGLIDGGRLRQGGAKNTTPVRRAFSPRRLWKRLAVHKFPYGASRLLRRAIVAILMPEKARLRACARAQAFLDEVARHARQGASLSSVLAALESDLNDTPSRIFAHLVPLIVPSMLTMSLVDRWLVRWLGFNPGAGLQLMRGMAGSVTTEMDLKLWELGKTIGQDPEGRCVLSAKPASEVAEAYREGSLPPATQQALNEFFDEYGTRGFAEIDIGRPRWREDPSFVLDTLRSYLEMEDSSLTPDTVFRRGAAEAERLRAEYAARLRAMRFGVVRAMCLNAAVRRMRVLGGLRELPKSYLGRVLYTYRALLLDHGQALTASGALSSAEDIFFVPLDVLRRFAHGEPLELKAAVAAHRDAYERESTRKQVPRLLLSTGEAFYGGTNDARSSDLIGDGVSPGIAEGPVRVVLSPHGVRLNAGEILVCRATDPGWTPLFLTAGGLVMEMGGLVTHGSVVAREYGIPAVVGVEEVTRRLRTGQRVQIDGSAGRVRVLD